MPGVANPSNQNVRAEIGERIWINEPIPAAGLPVTLTLDVSGSAAMMAGSDSLAPITDIFQDIFASIIMLPGGDQTQLLDASKSTVDGDSMASTTVSLFFYLPSDTSFFDVIYSLNLVQTNYNYQGEIDYYNTAIASIDLPEGYTFSSESGHFLSAPPPSEPPPSSTSPPMPWLPLLLE